MIQSLFSYWWRASATLACMFTLKTIITREGYRVEFTNILLAGIAVILGVLVWVPLLNDE